MLQEFKKFIMRGNVIDLAVGVIIGGAFGKIVTSLVNDIIMPLISLITGQVRFADRFLALDGKAYESLAQAREMGAAVLAYGAFIQNIIDFLIIAFCIFLIIRAFNRLTSMSKKEETKPEAPTTQDCPFCFTSISIQATRCPNCTSEIQKA